MSGATMALRPAPAGLVGSLDRLVRRHPVLCAAGTAALVLMVALLDFDAYFVANDDVVMRDLASGRMTGAPSERLVFINVTLGWPLRWLYDLVPSVPWYAAMLAMFAFVAIAAFFYLSFTRAPRGRAFAIGAVFLALVALAFAFVVGLTFTSVAILLAGAGTLVVVYGPPRPGWRRYAIPGLGGLMFGVASLLRFDSARGIAVAMLPLLVYALATRPARHWLAGAAVAGIVVGFGQVADAVSYGSDPGWRDYREFNLVRGALHDTTRLDLDPELREVLDEIGWSTNDLVAFRSWWLLDDDVVSTASLRRIGEETSLDPGDSLGALLRERLWGPYQRELILAGALVAAAAVLTTGRRRIAAVALAASFGAVLVYLAVLVRLPTRVGMPMLAVLVIGLVLLVSDEPRDPDSEQVARGGDPRSIVRLAVLCALGLVAIISVRQVSRDDAGRAAQVAGLRSVYYQFGAIDPGGVFVAPGATIPYQVEPPFDEAATANAARVVNLGWATRSPSFYEQLRRLGVNDIERSVAAGGHTYLVTMPQHWQQGTFERLVREHRGWNGVLRTVADVGNGTVVQRGLFDYRLDADTATLDERILGKRVGTYSVEERVGAGHVEGWAQVGLGRFVAGWAADPDTGAPPTAIVLLIDGVPVATSVPTDPRTDILENLGLEDTGFRHGFRLFLPDRLPDGARRDSSDVRVLALFGNRAVELPVAPGALGALGSR